MENSNIKSITGQVQLLFKTDKDFMRKFKRRLVHQSLHNEANVGLKGMMVQLALLIACYKGAGAVGGLMNALEESGNSEKIADLRTWIEQDFGCKTDVEPWEATGGASAVQAKTSAKLPKNKSWNEMIPSGTKLIGKMMTGVEDDLMEQLDGQLFERACRLVNCPELCSSLVHQEVLQENAIQFTSGPEVHRRRQIEKVRDVACSKEANASDDIAFEIIGNEYNLEEVYKPLPFLQEKYTIAVKSLSNSQELKVRRSTVFEQAATSSNLEKIGTFNCPVTPFPTGQFTFELDEVKLIAYLGDSTVKVWNWWAKEETTIKFRFQVKDTTWFQYDDEILISGTAAGTLHLFDARTFEEKWLMRLGEHVISLKFVDSTLIVITRGTEYKFWWVDICRPDMKLLNQRPSKCRAGCMQQAPGVSIYAGTSFLYCCQKVYIHHLKSGNRMRDENGLECFSAAPAIINTLIVGDLVATKRAVVAGCNDGRIAMWNTSKLINCHSQAKILQGHSDAIVSLCFVNGHLLSLDQSRKLLMWSGHDLENPFVTPVPRVVLENSDFSHLAGHERWFASSSSSYDTINIWTLPDLWLRTG